jgi:hypothetical protein
MAAIDLDIAQDVFDQLLQIHCRSYSVLRPF